MLQSLMIKLETTEDNKARLLETMKRYNEACNFVAKRAYSLKLANKYKLHKEVYHETRRRFGLSSQFVVSPYPSSRNWVPYSMTKEILELQ